MNMFLFFGQACGSSLCQQSLDFFQRKPGESVTVSFAIGIVLGVILGFVLAKVFGATSFKNGRSGSRAERRNSPVRHPAPADGSVEIYVGNLSYDLTEAQLLKEFEAFGKVKSARVLSNRFNNKSKGFGFVEMPNRPEAEKAIVALNDKDLLGRKIRVNEARNLEKLPA